MRFTLLKAFILIVVAGTIAPCASFSFNGFFTSDDAGRFFGLTLTSTSTVTLRTYSYAGGTNGAGMAVPGGGFDPILALFDSAGILINENDDGYSHVAPDPVTGQSWDSYLQTTLAAGTYTVSLTQFDNFPKGPNLSDGFPRTGQANFTSGFGCSDGMFCDLTGANRTANWEFTASNVDSAVDLNMVPEPALPALFALGLGCLAFLRRRSS